MTPPTWPLVPAEVDSWVADVNRTAVEVAAGRSPAPLPEVLARLHHDFECVHPFLDGNGRTGRLLVNLFLVRLGHPPVIVLKAQCTRYLDALARADTGDHGALGEILARAVHDNLNRFILPDVAGPARMVPLAALVTAEVTLPALRQAAQKGRLEAVQGADEVWRSNRTAVDAYCASRRPGRKANPAPPVSRRRRPPRPGAPVSRS